MRLVAGGVSGGKVEGGGGEEAGGYIAAMGDCRTCKIILVYRGSSVKGLWRRTTAYTPFFWEAGEVGMRV